MLLTRSNGRGNIITDDRMSVKKGETMSSLRGQRKMLKLTQEEVAKQVGINLRSYQRYEARERVPDVFTAQRIAKVLKTNVYDLWVMPQY